ncbi:hypothetical protein [Sphingomonas sp. 3-13AW]|uniref:hypothetical protein n=1 Tax=Sphingomonas sp. 3-13AW TaxID=3050450 RepID=UPI003BB600E3
MTNKMKSLFIAILAILAFTAGNIAVVEPAYAQNNPPQSAPRPVTTAESGFLPDLNIFTPSNTKNIGESVSDFLGLYNTTCWPCMIFDTFAATMFSKGQEVSGRAADPMRRIIASVSVVFCLVYLGGGLVAGDASDIARRWTTVWKFLLGAALGSIFVGSAFENMWSWVYGPVMAVPIAISQEFGQADANTLTIAGNAVACSLSSPSGPQGSAGIVQGMQGIVCGGHRLSGAGMAYGWALMTHTNGFFGTLTNLICGLILMSVFCWVAITFPLRFIDILIRLTIIGILSPVIIVLAVFKPTRSYVTTAIQNVLYVGCLFAFTGIMFNLGASVFSGVLNASLAGMQGASEDALTTIVNGIILIGGGIVFSAMIQMAPALAKEFSGFSGSGGGVGDAVGGAVSSAASVAGKGAGAALGAPIAWGKSYAGSQVNARVMSGKIAQALGKD